MKNDLIYLAVVALIRIINLLPRHVALMLGGFLGEVWYLLHSRDRRIAQAQMSQALGLSGGDLRAHARACFEMMGKNLVDAVRMSRWSKEYIGAIVDVDGFENIDREYRQGNGVIALTGHIGNFELIATWFSYYKGYKVSVIGRKLYDERFDRMLVEQRQRFGIQNIPNDSAVKRIMKALRDGHALGVLLDQDSRRVRGYFVDFFGRKALTAAGPVYIALKTGIPIVPLAIYRKPDDTYYMKVLPPLRLERTGDPEADVINGLYKCNRALEDLIGYDPTQWVWIHRRWRTRPPEETASRSQEEVEA